MEDILNEKLKEALEKRALGYEYEEKTVVAGKSGKPDKIQITRRHIPPDIKAIEQIRYLQLMGKW